MKAKQMFNPYLAATLAILTYIYWPDTAGFWQSPERQQLSQQDLVRQARSLRIAPPEINDRQRQLAQLGQRLFFDHRFSADGSVSCSSCHKPELDFTDGLKTAAGMGTTDRNTPTLINAYLLEWFFWDGRAHSLETQAKGPIEARLEHGSNRGQVAQTIALHYKESYEALFDPISVELEHLLKSPRFHASPNPKAKTNMSQRLASYGVATLSDFSLQTEFIQAAADQKMSPYAWFSQTMLHSESPPSDWIAAYQGLSPNLQKELDQIFLNFARAVAAYQRTIYAVNSPFDQFLAKLGDQKQAPQGFHSSFGEEQWQGFKVFAESGCINCHNGPLLSDQQFHNIGLPSHAKLDIGRARGLLLAQTSPVPCEAIEPQDREACMELRYADLENFEVMGAFKTPTLRNLAKTKPYMHDGRFDSIDQVLDHYEDHDQEPAIGHRSESIPRFQWSDEERQQLKLFLESLQSEWNILQVSRQETNKKSAG
ncbi:cytochrome-c peroxidase [Pseudobacteriovorax antillogorgiicola]|uniref:Di-haem cytochrome c peroxidase n=1 Tax=Pseudobacteriovorax antillogorgiicola TaxID=1513793 RepID=A0A1Y6BN78_9BACT|nr:cytochrome c peroxidase [Pseudobacteriovorax antillogorgiicola]TCS53898.1 di-heme cytochrome c peroxidase [Pseudobacteriovorax antillogorgiicola]SMF20810.1 Di-haem cytochrome c peroxidase [Pseudobacteriovorax antillogorgiicola]